MRSVPSPFAPSALVSLWPLHTKRQVRTHISDDSDQLALPPDVQPSGSTSDMNMFASAVFPAPLPWELPPARWRGTRDEGQQGSAVLPLGLPVWQKALVISA